MISNGWLPLASAHLFTSGLFSGTDTGLGVYVEYQSGSSNGTLFANVVWTPAMVGQTAIATPGTPAYDSFVSHLTNGISEHVGWADTLLPGGGGGASFSSENQFLTTHPPDWNGIDLAGYALTAVGLQMNQLSLVASGGSTSFSWDATFTVYTVPEPGALGLVLLGGNLILAARKHKERRSRSHTACA